MRPVSRCIWTGFLVIGLLFPTLSAQTLAFTLKTNASSTASGLGASQPGEILQLSPWEPPSHCLAHGALSLLIGDTNGNGIYDDGPSSINALAAPGGTSGGPTGFWMSFRTTTTFADGTVVLDGDVVQIETPGSPTIVYSEAHFEQITGTTGIDIDALYVDGAGRIFFSFAEDETSSSNWLIQQNGSDPTLDETTLFRWIPGDQEAVIYLNRAAVLTMVNNAMGLNLPTVVDLTGVAEDVSNPGSLLFTTGSANNSIEGWVFSTTGNGTVAALSGQILNPQAFAFDELERLEALCITPTQMPDLSIHIDVPIATGVGAMAFCRAVGATPFTDVYLLAGEAMFPSSVMQSIGGMMGSPLFLSSNDPLLMMSLSSPLFLRVSDVSGRVSFLFATPYLPAGLHIVVQAWDPAASTLSWPFTVEL